MQVATHRVDPTRWLPARANLRLVPERFGVGVRIAANLGALSLALEFLDSLHAIHKERRPEISQLVVAPDKVFSRDHDVGSILPAVPWMDYGPFG